MTIGLGGAFTATSRGPAMQLYSSSRPFYPLDPRAEDILLKDIAHGLSHLCRFGGQCKEFYSVAQHSTRVSYVVPPELAREALLHDAAEAYVGDMVRPLKSIFPLFREIEGKIAGAIAERFSLRYPWPPEIKEADDVLLSTEKRDLMRPADWGPMPEPLPSSVFSLHPSAAKAIFLGRAEELGIS